MLRARRPIMLALAFVSADVASLSFAGQLGVPPAAPLRGVAVLDTTPIYAESLEALFRFGGYPLYSLAIGPSRLVRGAQDETSGVTAPETAKTLATDCPFKAGCNRFGFCLVPIDD